MNDFDRARQIETIARDELLPWLCAHSENVEATDASLFIQKVWGDWIVTKHGRLYGVELKAEQANRHGNLFLETWSNRSCLTPGWMVTSKADTLFYYFCEQRQLLVMRLRPLQQWAFGTRETAGQIYRYPERPQSKYANQLNDTWGRCVPIDVVRRLPAVHCSEWRGSDAGRFTIIHRPVDEVTGTLAEAWADQF